MHPMQLAEMLWGCELWEEAYNAADVLVIDEISMVSYELLEKVR